jgi:nucleotide-binding universal stress UspA family protein
LLLVHVIELPEVTPLDAAVPYVDRRAAQILRAGERVAAAHDRRVQALTVRARSAGQALLDEMIEKGVDLAVLGSHQNRTMSEILWGTTHQYLTRRAPCRILLDVPARKRRQRANPAVKRSRPSSDSAMINSAA